MTTKDREPDTRGLAVTVCRGTAESAPLSTPRPAVAGSCAAAALGADETCELLSRRGCEAAT
jgi:hypothetical protein